MPVTFFIFEFSRKHVSNDACIIREFMKKTIVDFSEN